MSLFGARGKRDKRKTRGSRDTADAAGARTPEGVGVRQSTSFAESPDDSHGGGAVRRSPDRASRRGSKRGTTPQSGAGGQPQEGAELANIGQSVVFKGDLSSEEDLDLEGRVEGQIQLPNHQLTIGAHGEAHAEIHAKVVIVTGRVVGNVSASERCEVQASGVVDGNIRAARLLIQEGAVVNGHVEMGDAAAAAQAPKPAPPAQLDRETA